MKVFIAIGIAISLAIVLMFAWILNDLRLELKHSAATVNTHLPDILNNTRRTTETLAEVSSDIKDLRNLAGVSDTPRDATLVTYADSVLDLIESQNATIGTEKLIGKELSDPIPAKEWVAGARKEAVWLTFRAKTKSELLDRLTQTKFGSAWRIKIAEEAPVSLRDWFIENHPPTAETQASDPAQDAS